TFQALRIFVNDELGELARGLSGAEGLLAEGGRLAVVTFHSLEDRIVKRFLTERTGRAGRPNRYMPAVEEEAPSFEEIAHKARKASDAEVETNARARSAKLRAAIRTTAPRRPLDLGALGFRAVPSLDGGVA
ncbi:MAG: 16S rRNA (cytosine(1402)-N(4))-methyltransferase, partial [Parvibaculum sp.]|nr:16S rRNA (cytosine(1402)-N(4))-methyltransferase [Parvibaculum sp.]